MLRVELLPATWTPHMVQAQVPDEPLPIQLTVHGPEKAAEGDPVPGPMWGAWIKLLAPDFSLDQPWPPAALCSSSEKESADRSPRYLGISFRPFCNTALIKKSLKIMLEK